MASASPRRSELLGSLKIGVEIVTSGYREIDLPGTSPLELARAHARGKASRVLAERPHDLIVAADTVVDIDGRSFGKPRDRDDAVLMLRSLSGRSHLVHTAFAVWSEPELIERDSTTSVTFCRLSDETIERYVDTGDPFDKAGAYGIQGIGASLVDRIDGDFYTVMGFPLGLFVRTLSERGIVLAPATVQA